jgi:hypothetical protein
VNKHQQERSAQNSNSSQNKGSNMNPNSVYWTLTQCAQSLKPWLKLDITSHFAQSPQPWRKNLQTFACGRSFGKP